MSDLTHKLQALEQLLKQLELWQENEIDPALLTSLEPFCCDTLAFEQWLQFIFIPKMHHLIVKQQLPKTVGIAAMAEYLWDGQARYRPLITLLHEIDALFSA
jgi:uncharacterized protein YqcC (DUF446 family)